MLKVGSFAAGGGWGRRRHKRDGLENGEEVDMHFREKEEEEAVGKKFGPRFRNKLLSAGGGGGPDGGVSDFKKNFCRTFF